MKMRRILFVFSAIVAAFTLESCSSCSLMTQENFNTVAAGNPINRVEEVYGPPFDTKVLSNGMVEYRYINRIPVSSTEVDQEEYVFIVQNGRIINKERRQVSSAFNCSFN